MTLFSTKQEAHIDFAGAQELTFWKQTFVCWHPAIQSTSNLTQERRPQVPNKTTTKLYLQAQSSATMNSKHSPSTCNAVSREPYQHT